MAFSMALSGAKKSKPSVQPSAVGFGGTVADDEEPRVETVAVTEMMDGKTDADKEPEVKVIAGAPNTFALGGAQHLRNVIPVNALLGPDSMAAVAEIAAAAATAASAAAAVVPAAGGDEAAPRGSASGSVVPVDEESAAAEAVLAELRAGGTSIFGADDTERYRRDVQTRADSIESRRLRGDLDRGVW
jgi:hypothetical protein